MQLTNSMVFATSGASLFVVLSLLVFAETGCQTERDSQPADTHDIADDTDPASTSALPEEEDLSAASGSDAAAPGADGAAPWPAAATLSDAEISSITQAINSGEIELGELAVEKAENPDVRRFAQRMVADHRALAQENVAISTQPGGPAEGPQDAGGAAGELTPAPGQAGASELMGILTSETEATKDRLRSLSGGEFDRAYIDSQVRMHAQALALVERHLLPGADDSRLESSLEKAQSSVESHLQEAESLRDQLTEGEVSSDV